MSRYKRYVLGTNDDGKSCVALSNDTPVIEQPGTYWRTDIWAVPEVPTDLSKIDDPVTESLPRNPPVGGLYFRMNELWPDKTGEAREEHIRTLMEFHKIANQKHMPSEEDLKRHPGMHLVDFLVVTFVVRGEAYVMTDTDEVLVRQGDSVVIPGVNHAWSNRSNETVLIASTLINAKHREN